jgi:O-antigen ligase
MIRPNSPIARSPAAIVGAIVIVTALTGVIAAYLWTPAFLLLGLLLVGLIGFSASRWPRTAIVVVVLSPILDRYLIVGVLPEELSLVTHVFSEALLVVVGLVVAYGAWRAGRLGPALRHPVSVALVAFGLIAIVSSIANGVPIEVAATGVAFTVDAAACFFLPRMVGFSTRQSLIGLGMVGGLVLLAALVAVAQALLSPNILGLSALHGRFGEVYRLASFLGDPNAFGAFLLMAAPFTLFAVTRLPNPRDRRIALAITFILVLALWLSFSRGAWIGLLVGTGLVALLLDRRALLIGAVVTAVAFGTAVVMPRDLLISRSPGTGGSSEEPERPNLIDSTMGRLDTVGSGRDLRTLFIINALPIIRDHPIVGVGPGRYGGAAADIFGTPVYEAYGTDALFSNPTQTTVDNFWLHVLVEFGIAGFASLLAAALFPGIAVLRAAWRVRRGATAVLLAGIAAATAGLAVNSVSTMLLEANSIAFSFWFLLGIGSLLASRATSEPVEASVRTDAA